MALTITHRPKAGAVLTGTEYEADDAHIVSGSTGGGIDTSLTIYLEGNGSVTGAGNPIWDTIYDARSNVIGAIPADMGLSLADDLLTATEEGVWFAELMANPTPDDTARVAAAFGTTGATYSGGNVGVMVTPNEAPDGFFSCEIGINTILPLTTGDSFRFAVAYKTGTATASPYQQWGYGVLQITRLA